MFFSKELISVKYLSKKLFVSTNTIYNDLKKIEEWLGKQNLFLVSKRNTIKIDGKEEDYRKTLSYFFSDLNKINCYEDVKNEEYIYQDYEGRIDTNNLLQLKQIIDLDYGFLEKMLKKLELELDFEFSQNAFINLILHIAISIRRIEEGKDIFMPENIFKTIVDTKEFKSAKKLTEILEEKFNFKIPESEIGYITLHILGSKKYREDFSDFQLTVEDLEDLGLPLIMAKEIIDIASNALNIDLTQDEGLLSGLVLHLRPTINRVKYGLSFKNPILEDIKENYPEIYGVSWMTSIVFKKYLGIGIPESEIGYIAMHIGAAVERNKQKIKTMVVCHTGIGTSQLLFTRLKKSFIELDLIGVRSSIVLEEKDLSDVELIISTVPLRTKITYILVNPILNSKDIKLIEKYIVEYYDKREGKQFLDKEIFFNVSGFRKKEQVLNDLCSKLEERRYVTKSFVDTVLERENIVSTEVGKSLVIPHGLSKEVKKSCIALMVLDQSIKWDEDYIKYILVVCLIDEDISKGKRIFKKLSELIENDKFFKEISDSPKRAKQGLELLER